MTCLRFCTARSVVPLVLSLGLAGGAVAQDPPTTNRGLTSDTMGQMDLTDQNIDTDQRGFRMRRITVLPGGVIALHSHENRPSIEYVISGTGREFRDGTETDYTADTAPMIADVTVDHYWLNTGDVPLVILAVDLYTPFAPE